MRLAAWLLAGLLAGSGVLAGSGIPALAADPTSAFTVALPGNTLSFTAEVASLRPADAQGSAPAEVGSIAYTVAGAGRPVTFVVNGGPGASSAWLQLGAVGPWRTPLAGAEPSTTPDLLPNADTWLDFTDLVFLDPPGTGFTPLPSDAEAKRQALSVNGDVGLLAGAIRLWVTRHHRETSAKYILGESYGGFRAPKIARALQGSSGAAPRGLLLLSPKLDFGRSDALDVFDDVALLPSMAAAAREQGRSAATPDAVLQYATGDYLADLLRGPRDAAAVERMTTRVAAMTGLEPSLVRRRAGRIDAATFLREEDRRGRRVGSAYDATVSAADPFPGSTDTEAPDALLDGLQGPLGGAVRLLNARLGLAPRDGVYQLLNRGLSRQWDFGDGNRRPEAVSDLQQVLALDPGLRVLIVHGATDLVLPWLGTRLILDQVPEIDPPARLSLLVIPGGHMPYLRDASRHALHEAGRALVEGAALP